MQKDSPQQKVIIFSQHFQISGCLSIYEGVRLTDYMNESKDFISVTDAEIKCREKGTTLQASFFNIRKDDIEIVIPEGTIIASEF